MWFKNLVVYRVPKKWSLSPEKLEAMLEKHVFSPGNSLEESSLGWFPPRENNPALVVTIKGQMLINLRQEKKLLPPKVIAQVLKQRVEKIEAEEGFKPGRKQMKELRELVRDELLPRAFTLTSDTLAWIDRKNGWLVINAGSSNAAEEMFSLLARSIDKFPAQMLKVNLATSTAMTDWLVSQDPPKPFTVDQDAELKSAESKASIRYSNESLDQREVTKHVKNGKQCTKLAMTWADKISFMLTDKLEIKRLRALDVLNESNDSGATDDEERFESDMMLMTGELSKMLDDVVDALGGETLARAA